LYFPVFAYSSRAILKAFFDDSPNVLTSPVKGVIRPIFTISFPREYPVQIKEIKRNKQIHRAFFILPFLLAGIFYIIKTIVSRRKATLLYKGNRWMRE
jgi:hypothetical protein